MKPKPGWCRYCGGERITESKPEGKYWVCRDCGKVTPRLNGGSMKFLRWIGCKLNIHHRIQERWWPKETSGLNAFSAALYGSVEKDGKYRYFRCMDCKTILAPFEVKRRGWTPVAE